MAVAAMPGGIYLPAYVAVVGKHITLHADGGHEHQHGQQPCVHGLRIHDLVDRFQAQLHAHNDDDDGHSHTGEVFDPAMTERMPGIRLFRRHPEAQERYDGGTGVRKVVEGVRRHGDGAGEPSGQVFAQEEKHVQADAGKRAEHAVGAAHGGVRHLVPVFDKKPC